MRCTFCATGKGGFARNLGAHEIVDQVLTVQERFGKRVSNVGECRAAGTGCDAGVGRCCYGLTRARMHTVVSLTGGLMACLKGVQGRFACAERRAAGVGLHGRHVV